MAVGLRRRAVTVRPRDRPGTKVASTEVDRVSQDDDGPARRGPRPLERRVLGESEGQGWHDRAASVGAGRGAVSADNDDSADSADNARSG